MELNNSSCVYVLCDPCGNIRYVGKTGIKYPFKRLNQHIYEARRSPNLNYRTKWIRSILNTGLKPTMKIIEICETRLVEEREREYIKRFRINGKKLTNLTDGGEGMPGHVPSIESRLKMSNSHKGKISSSKEARSKGLINYWNKNPERKLRLSSSMTGAGNPFWGKKHSEESKKLNSELHRGRTHKGVVHSEKSKKLMSIAKSGPSHPKWGKPGNMLGKKQSDETKKKMSDAHKARWKAIKDKAQNAAALKNTA